MISLVGPGHKWCIEKTKNLRNKDVGTQRHRQGEENLIEEEKFYVQLLLPFLQVLKLSPQ